MKRRALLTAALVSLAGAGAWGFHRNRLSTDATPDPGPDISPDQTSILDRGVVIDDVAAAETNAAAIIAAMSETKEHLFFPKGRYFLDNSRGILIRRFSGQVTMSPGAWIVFTSERERGLEFFSSHGARWKGLSTLTVPLPRVCSSHSAKTLRWSMC